MRYTLSGATKAERVAARSVFVPKHAEAIYVSDEAAVYRYTLPRGGYAVIAFWGSAGRPTAHYSYRNLEKANQAIEAWIDRVSLYRVEQVRKRASRAAWVN